MYWKIVAVNDQRARMLADKHYSRQNPGTNGFTPPGNSIVLLGLNNDSLWVSHRPDPTAGLETKRKDGMDYYDNPYFRNESDQIASELIRQALAVTRYIWQDFEPPDGFHTFVNPRKVKPLKYGKPKPGWVFMKAGFVLYPKLTKARKLLRFVLSLEKFMAIEPVAPANEQLELF